MNARGGAPMILGAALVVTGSLVVFGALTGRLPAMLAVIFKPEDLKDAATGKSIPQKVVKAATSVGKDELKLAENPLGTLWDQGKKLVDAL